MVTWKFFTLKKRFSNYPNCTERLYLIHLSAVDVNRGQSVFSPMLVYWSFLLTIDRFAIIVFVDSIFEVLAGMSPSAFFSILRSRYGLHGVDHQVLKFQSFHEIGIPDHRPVRDFEVLHLPIYVRHLFTTLLKGIRGSEDSRVRLHRLLHAQPQICRGNGAAGVSYPIQIGYAFFAGVLQRKILLEVHYNCIHALLARTGFKSPIVWLGLFSAAMVLAQALPKTTRSRRELAPSRFAPWTEAHADSPQAYKPGTTLSLPFCVVNTCPL